MYSLDRLTDILWGRIGLKRCDEVQKIVALEAHRFAPVYGRSPDVPIAASQFANTEMQVGLGFDVTAQADVYGRHFAYPGISPRSISTPTSFEPRIAPGLCNLTRTQATSNSSRMMPAIRSASVSTS